MNVTYTPRVRKRIKGGWWWQVTLDEYPAVAGYGSSGGYGFVWEWRPTRKWAVSKATRVAARLRNQLTDQKVQDGQPWEGA